MSVKANWERLYKFWHELDFDTAKKNDYEIKKSIGDILEFSEDDIERIKDLVSINREFKPASDDEILEVETKLNITLPENFKESLKINAFETNVQDFVYPWLGGWNILLNCEEMLSFTLRSRKLDFDVFDNRIELNDEYRRWNEKWVIIFQWNMDYFIVLDLSDDPKKYGQVLCLCIEDGSIAKWADSFKTWFEEAVNEVEQFGELRTETIESVLGVGT